MRPMTVKNTFSTGIRSINFYEESLVDLLPLLRNCYKRVASIAIVYGTIKDRKPHCKVK